MSRFALATALLCLASCGYVGDPLPPALMLPVPVNDLAAVQRGDKIVIQWTLSGMTNDAIALDLYGDVDLRIGPGPSPWSAAEWEREATRIAVEEPYIPGAWRIEAGVAGWVGQQVLIAVRTANTRGRRSDWSNMVALTVIDPLAPPRDLRAEPVPEGVRLTWVASQGREGLRFRVFRQQEDSQTLLRLGETEQPEWTDAGVEYGHTYGYMVQAVAPAADGVAESELAEPAVVTPADIFPPPTPTGLTAIAGLDTIELSWERSAEEGPVRYSVYRAEGDAAPLPLVEALAVPGYSDEKITSGRRYRYTVTATDAHGNESEPAGPVEQVAP